MMNGSSRETYSENLVFVLSLWQYSFNVCNFNSYTNFNFLHFKFILKASLHECTAQVSPHYITYTLSAV